MRSLKDTQTLSLFIHKIREGIYLTAEDGRILDCNPAFLEMFGVGSLEEMQSHTAQSLLVDPKRRAEEQKLLEATGALREFELEIRRPDGQVRTVLDTAYRVVDESTGEALYHGILVDITDRKDLEGQLRELAVRDPLTGCYNRRILNEKAADLEGKGVGWGVIVLDLDHFKSYNDRYGHDMGDRLLVWVGRFLASEVRTDDPVIRTGGDEFVVLLPELTLDSTREVAERLHRKGLTSSPVSFTLGWAAREGSERVDDTMRRADQFLVRVRVEERKPRPRTATARSRRGE